VSVHGSLVEPTRQRLKLVLDGSVGICLGFFSIVGLCGYLDAYECTMDNVFLDYTISDHIILVGRMGYGFAVLFGLPLVSLPCRESFLSIPDQIAVWRHEAAQRKQYKSLSTNDNNGHLFVNGVNFDQEMPPPWGSPNNKPSCTAAFPKKERTAARRLFRP
jgi:hypothetical protein